MRLRGAGWGLLLAETVGAAAQASSPVYCPIRLARTDAALASALVRADKLKEDAAAGRGDHCDVQLVEGPILKVLKGPLPTGQTVTFTLSQGACGDPHSVNDDFVAQGDQLVVLFGRLADGRLYQVQSEPPSEYAAKEKMCGR